MREATECTAVNRQHHSVVQPCISTTYLQTVIKHGYHDYLLAS